MAHSPTAKPQSKDRHELSIFRGTVALVAITSLFGGGGAPNPLVQALLEALAFLWLMFVLWFGAFVRPLPRDARVPLLFVAGIAIIAGLQLVPLPYALWSGLPGRRLAAEVHHAAGLGGSWFPLSLDPEQTLVTVIALIPSITIGLSAYLLNGKQRLLLLQVAAIVVVVSALLGSLQASMPNTPALYIHKKTYFDLPSGIFANRNFQANFLVQGILLCGLQLRMGDLKGGLAARPSRISPVNLVCLVAIPFLALMTLATLSRFGAAMVAPALLAAFVIAWKPTKRATAAAAAALLVAPFALWFLLSSLSQPLVERFLTASSRTDLIPDVWFAVKQYFPVGSGLGTFEPVINQVESLGTMESAYMNHAHNDYLEILLEGGVAGALLTAIFLLAFALRAVRVWIRGGEQTYHWGQRVSALGIALILLHSIVDYPLRTMTLQSLFALYTAILFSTPPAQRRPQRSHG